MCDCIQDVQKKLQDSGSNTMLDIPLYRMGEIFRADRVKIAVCKRDTMKREKPFPFIAAYCPFCGKKYRPEATPKNTQPERGEIIKIIQPDQEGP